MDESQAVQGICIPTDAKQARERLIKTVEFLPPLPPIPAVQRRLATPGHHSIAHYNPYAEVKTLGIPVYLGVIARGLLVKQNRLQMRENRREALCDADITGLGVRIFHRYLDFCDLIMAEEASQISEPPFVAITGQFFRARQIFIRDVNQY
ncbi:hypothetical protein ANCCEY_06602 [Ancylostoma ceylanicum]|uniref:Uncharacterized protein n=1 Tax=Ancylostoma ceylanicum TaxID=53326 RepID=A0A0D6LQJ0_9BILA|nr:hypothetical protein ANCCEY_06602 [Ancylostoma ceylanicum]